MLSKEKIESLWEQFNGYPGSVFDFANAVAVAAVKDAVGGEVVEDFDDHMDAAAKDRYHLGETKGFTPFPCAVYAGTGTQELFRGSRSTCLHVARILTGAFLDGGFIASKYAKPQVSAAVPEGFVLVPIATVLDAAAALIKSVGDHADDLGKRLAASQPEVKS